MMKTPKMTKTKLKPRTGLRLSTMILTAMALGACETTPDFKKHVPYAPQSGYAATATQVTQGRTISFEGDALTLTDQARRDIDGFLADHRVDRTDRLFVVVSEDADEIALGRAKRVRAYLAVRRLSADVIARKIKSRSPSQVILIAERYQVTLPGCPNWTGTGGITHDNRPSSNWGCANAVNLGLMIANPRDLAIGRDPGYGDGEALVLGIQRYRAGETKPLLGSATGTAAPASESSEKGGDK